MQNLTSLPSSGSSKNNALSLQKKKINTHSPVRKRLRPGTGMAQVSDSVCPAERKREREIGLEEGMWRRYWGGCSSKLGRLSFLGRATRGGFVRLDKLVFRRQMEGVKLVFTVCILKERNA
jgi:hypothetical protein